jgi:hypothetical protein
MREWGSGVRAGAADRPTDRSLRQRLSAADRPTKVGSQVCQVVRSPGVRLLHVNSTHQRHTRVWPISVTALGYRP